MTNFPCKLTVADTFNDFFTSIGQKMASQVPKLSRTFETYINRVNVKMDSKTLSINEFKDTFFSVKVNKNSGVDDVSFSIIKKCFGVLCEPFIYLFQRSLKKGVFLNDLKLAKVTLINKAGDSSQINNYKSMSALSCFSMTFEGLIYSRLYKHLKENNVLYEKQFGFHSGYSTNNAIIQLADKVF